MPMPMPMPGLGLLRSTGDRIAIAFTVDYTYTSRAIKLLDG